MLLIVRSMKTTLDIFSMRDDLEDNEHSHRIGLIEYSLFE